MLNYIFGNRTQESSEKELDDLILMLLKSNSEVLKDNLMKLSRYIPDFTQHILKQMLNQMVDILRKPASSSELVNSVIEILFQMISNANRTIVAQDPFPILKLHPLLLDALFTRTYPLDPNLNSIIQSLYVREPEIFTQFIKQSPTSLRTLIDSTAETKNPEAGSLLFQLCRLSLETYLPYIIPRIKELPVSTVVAFMSSSPQIISQFTDKEIPSWLSKFNRFKLLDLRQLFIYYPKFWLSLSSLSLLLRADCHSIPLRQLEFFHKMQPQQLQLPLETTKQASNEIFSSPEPISVFSSSFSEIGHINSDAQTYGFIRLYVLSFSNSNDLIEGCSQFIENLMFDKSEWIAAASIQCIILWIINLVMIHYIKLLLVF